MVPIPPLGESLGAGGRGVVKELNPKENRVRSQFGSKRLVGGAWPGRWSCQGPKRHRVSYMSNLPTYIHTIHTTAQRGAREGAPGGGRWVDPHSCPLSYT